MTLLGQYYNTIKTPGRHHQSTTIPERQLHCTDSRLGLELQDALLNQEFDNPDNSSARHQPGRVQTKTEEEQGGRHGQQEG